MTRRTTRCLAALGAAAATTALGLGPAAPAHADGGWEVYSTLSGTMSWLTRGPVAGSPGNAHTGVLYENSDEGYDSFELIDWRCPRGATPPNGLVTDGSCDLLRDRSLFPDEATRDESGPLALSLGGTWAVATSYWRHGEQVGSDDSTATIDIDVVRVGPLQRTDTHSPGEWDTTYTARMQLRGTVLDVTLPNSRSPQTSNWTRTIARYR